ASAARRRRAPAGRAVARPAAAARARAFVARRSLARRSFARRRGSAWESRTRSRRRARLRRRSDVASAASLPRADAASHQRLALVGLDQRPVGSVFVHVGLLGG